VHAQQSCATCVLESALRMCVYLCVREDTFEARMVTVFDHPSSRNDCNPSIRPPKPIYQTQVELAAPLSLSLSLSLFLLYTPPVLFFL